MGRGALVLDGRVGVGLGLGVASWVGAAGLATGAAVGPGLGLAPDTLCICSKPC